MPRPLTSSDAELADAIARSNSWRAVLRALGYRSTSGSMMRSLRHRADRLNLDCSHFTGQRSWTDEQLADAVSVSGSWSEVSERLGLKGGSGPTTLKAHARRLEFDTSRVDAERNSATQEFPHFAPQPAHLSRAGTTLAAAWFALCGRDVSWPLEPCRYDLMVMLDEPARIQVKTASVRSGDGWVVWLSTTGGKRRVYDPDEIDYFFIIDAELNYYLIPVDVVGGFHSIHLLKYQRYRVPTTWP